MKRFIYALMLLVFLSTAFTACTEESVEPSTGDTQNGGGGISPDPLKP